MPAAIIIGAGPAGISAGLYLHRGMPGATITVLTKGEGTGALARAESIENYYGLAEPISGAELERRGLAGARRLGLEIVTSEVYGLRLNDTLNGFIVETDKGDRTADVVILAPGAPRERPQALPGLTELTGHGVSYCAICDGFLYRGRRAGVLGAGDYALHELGVLQPVAGETVLLTNGEPAPADVPDGVTVYTAPLARLLDTNEAAAAKTTTTPITSKLATSPADGAVTSPAAAAASTAKASGTGQRAAALPHFDLSQIPGAAPQLAAVRLADGTDIPLDGLFIALGTAGSTALARKVGALLTDDGRSIRTDDDMATNVPGLFVAGDATGGLLQVAKAVYDGAKAGLAAVRYLRHR